MGNRDRGAMLIACLGVREVEPFNIRGCLNAECADHWACPGAS